MTTIKITQLTDIGANLASSTVLPVVNMAGTPTTEKTVLGNIANVVLAGAGDDYVAAAKATIANTVTTNAQPNITSVGTLTSLSVTGNASSGNVLATSLVQGTTVTALDQLNTANLSANGLANIARINVTNTANLGAVGNVTITGGTSGYVLQTDGAGNLSWVVQSGGGGSYSNSNVASYLPTYTGNIGVDTLMFTDNTFQATAFVGTATTAEGLSNVGNAIIEVDPLGNTKTWSFDNTGNLNTPGNIVGPANANITIYANAGVHEFIFGDDGTFYAPDNVVLGGNSIYIGPGANTLSGIEHEVFIASSNLFPYVQAVVNNISDNGSADWVALGARGGDTGGQASLGFTSSGFGDANYTITGNGDGYVLVQSYAPGQTLLGGGGNLVLATGNQGSVKDIIFGTGGFLTANTFGRISHSNNSLELTRTGASLTFPDGSIQTTAYTGGGGGNVSELVNGNNSLVLDGDGNIVLEGNVAGQGIDRGLVWDYGANANGVNSMVRQDNDGITVRAWTEQGGGANGYSAPVNIVTNQDANTNTWTFDGSGNLTLPGNLNIPTGNIVSNIVTPAFNSAITSIVSTGNANVIITIASEIFEGPFSGQVTISGVNPPVQVNGDWYYQAVEYDQFQLYTDANLTTPVDGSSWPGYVDGGTAVGIGAYGDLTVQGGNVSINSDDKTWTFDNTGNLTLPGNTFAVNYANGVQVSIGGGSGNTGNVTFDDNIVIGTGDEYGGDGLYLATGPDGVANLQYLRLRGGDQPTHIHLDTGNNEFYDQYFGDDGKFVKLEAGGFGNVSIGTQDLSNNNIWTFTTDANLILAGGNSVIQSIANSSLDPTLPNVSTMTLTPDSNYYLQALVLDPTAPGHIHLRATASSNIDEPNANLFLGGENTAFEITQGTNNQAIIHSGGNTWTFGNDGTLTLPGNLVYIGASPAPSISGFNSVSAEEFTNDTSNVTINANSNTWNFDSTGNLTIPSTSGGFIKTASNASIGIVAMDNGTNNPAQLLSMNVGNGNATSIVSAYATNVAIQTNASGAINTWQFDNAGNLTLPGNISGNTNGYTIGYLNIPQVAASNTTIALSDAGKHYYSTTAGNLTLTIPNNATTSFATGTAISIVVQAAGNILVNAAGGVTLYMAGNSTAANRVVGGYGMATLMKVGTDTWFINGTGVS